MISTTEPRVTAVITAFNAERYIGRAIGSALNQTFGPIHVIVVDDGSSDNTFGIAKSYGNEVKVIRLEENRGPAVGRTTGLMKAKTEFVAFLDSDDYWENEFVRETVEFLDNHPESIAVFTGFYSMKWNGNSSCSLNNLDIKDNNYYLPDGSPCPNFYRFWAKYMDVRTGTVMMKTEAAQQTGGQREDLLLAEDLEFWAYLGTFGQWGFIPKPLFVTDQLSITPKERLKKIKRRYNFFRELTVEDWGRRVIPRLKDPVSREGFEKILHHIALTIALANAYTFRFRKSYQYTKKYGRHFGSGLGAFLRIGAKGGPLLWPLVCLMFRIREPLKTYFKSPFSRLKKANRSRLANDNFNR